MAPKNGYRDWVLAFTVGASLALIGGGLVVWRDVGAQDVKIEALEKKTETVPQDIATTKAAIVDIKDDIKEIKEMLRDHARDTAPRASGG